MNHILILPYLFLSSLLFTTPFSILSLILSKQNCNQDETTIFTFLLLFGYLSLIGNLLLVGSELIYLCLRNKISFDPSALINILPFCFYLVLWIVGTNVLFFHGNTCNADVVIIRFAYGIEFLLLFLIFQHLLYITGFLRNYFTSDISYQQLEEKNFQII